MSHADAAVQRALRTDLARMTTALADAFVTQAIFASQWEPYSAKSLVEAVLHTMADSPQAEWSLTKLVSRLRARGRLEGRESIRRAVRRLCERGVVERCYLGHYALASSTLVR